MVERDTERDDKALAEELAARLDAGMLTPTEDDSPDTPEQKGRQGKEDAQPFQTGHPPRPQKTDIDGQLEEREDQRSQEATGQDAGDARHTHGNLPGQEATGQGERAVPI